MNLTAKEIEEKLCAIHDINDPFFLACQKDERKTVQKLVKKWLKQYEKEQQLRQQFQNMCKYERALKEKGFRMLAGIDEVGRGCLAGPVVAACVILPDEFYLPGLTDSKKISKQKREEFFQYIMDRAVDVGIGFVSAKEIDELNIYNATKKAMLLAIDQLKQAKPDHLLIDALELPINIPQLSIIKGDEKSITIAASSCIAKVVRDRYMEELGKQFPEYGFERHVGYGTKQHLEAIEKHGVTEHHRKSFAPVQDALNFFNG
ncbi:ribonuclease HII [Aeribacillus pallidus]|uniref:ribonuclease HII n=1 Tax=Aeribacillus pallidus TaxID=33936 RepID=UPI001022C76B|nr:ribonuclease HII [Aeribacillus pallidus]